MILDDIAAYLVAQSTAFTLLSGTVGNLAKAKNLDTAPVPNTLTSIYENAGLPPVHTFSTGSQAARAFTRPNIQTITRSTSYQTARNHAEIIFGLLDGYSGTLPTATSTGNYLSIDAIQSPFAIGRDRNDRHLVSCNYEVRRV